jgi:hypothetical protein
MRDLHGRGRHTWYRRGVLAVLMVLVGVALTGALGQSERVTRTTGPAARIDLRAPRTLRGGLLWHARITIRASRRLVRPQVVLGPGYDGGMQLNTLEPAAVDEVGQGGSLALTYATLQAGSRPSLDLQLQVNPDTIGRQDLTVALEARGVPRVVLPASVVVLP